MTIPPPSAERLLDNKWGTAQGITPFQQICWSSTHSQPPNVEGSGTERRDEKRMTETPPRLLSCLSLACWSSTTCCFSLQAWFSDQEQLPRALCWVAEQSITRKQRWLVILKRQVCTTTGSQSGDSRWCPLDPQHSRGAGSRSWRALYSSTGSFTFLGRGIHVFYFFPLWNMHA